MLNTKKLLFGALCLGVSTLATAAPFDGSAPMLCAVAATVSCDSKGECVAGSAQAVNLPVFLKVDVVAFCLMFYIRMRYNPIQLVSN